MRHLLSVVGCLHYLKDAGIPYARLHDVGGQLGRGLYVDIPNLFPDFAADETRPENYRFDVTDGPCDIACDDRTALMVANVSDSAKPLSVRGLSGLVSGFLTDEMRSREPTGVPSELPPHSILFLGSAP